MSLLCKTRLKIPKSPPLLRIASRMFSDERHGSSVSDVPTSASYDELVAIAGHCKDLDSLHRLLNKRAKDGCFNTRRTFSFLTDHDLDDLIQTLARLDPGFTRKNAFDSLVSHLCKTNRIEDSVRVITAMIRGQYGINATTFHPLLNALTRKRKTDEAWRILAMMKESGIHVDVTAYNYILTAHCVVGEVMEAAGVVKKIVEERLKEDARTYDAMVLGACRVGRVEGAMVVLRRMEEERVAALYSTHAHVIKGLMGLGCFGEALEYVRAVGGRDKELDTQNFGFLGSCFVRKRRVVEAKLVFEEMDERKLVVGEKLRRDYISLLDANLK